MSDSSAVPPEPPTEPPTEPATGGEQERRRRRRMIIIVAAVVLALAAVALVLRMILPVQQTSTTGPVNTAVATATASATASATATSTATGTPVQTPSASPGPPATTSPPVVEETAAPRPTDCTQLYSPGMVTTLGQQELTLNPAWTQVPGTEVMPGSDDPQLRALIAANEHLTCVWASPAGATGVGLTTELVWVTADVRNAVKSRLEALGMDCTVQDGGLGCVTWTSTADGAFGEWHFLRDGIWLASKFSNTSPEGYTKDIVSNLWPGG